MEVSKKTLEQIKESASMAAFIDTMTKEWDTEVFVAMVYSLVDIRKKRGEDVVNPMFAGLGYLIHNNDDDEE